MAKSKAKKNGKWYYSEKWRKFLVTIAYILVGLPWIIIFSSAALVIIAQNNDNFYISKEVISDMYLYNSLVETIAPLQNEKYNKKEELISKIRGYIGGEKYSKFESQLSSLIEYDSQEEYYMLTAKNLKKIPNDLIDKFKGLQGSKYKDKSKLTAEIEKTIGVESLKEYENLLIHSIDYQAKQKSDIERYENLILYCAIFFLIGSIFVAPVLISISERIGSTDEVEEAVERALDESANIVSIWDMARKILWEYFMANLKQNKAIFWASVVIMTAGAVIVFAGLYLLYKGDIAVVIASTSAGIITELIGATFLFVYKSTVAQAVRYVDALEKINIVGMSLKALEAVKEEDKDKEKITDARIEISKRIVDALKQ